MHYASPYAMGTSNRIDAEWTTGTRLKRYLASRGISRNALVKASGVPHQTVSRIMSGDRIGSLNTWMRISAALHCSLSEIIEPETLRGGSDED